MDGLVTWAGLLTMAGAVPIVLLIVQFFKTVPFMAKVDTRVFAYIVSLVIMVAATYFSGGAIDAYAIAIVNAVIVASSAMGIYTVTFAKSDEAKKVGE